MALIGIGLIGSSIAQVARQRGLVKEISISTRSPATLQRAEELGLGDHYALDAAVAVEGADLVILCVPVGANEAVAKWIAPALKKGAIVSDVGSTKESVVAQVSPHMPEGVHFIPGHPIAGTEHSGPDAGFATLFDQRWCILTPSGNVDPVALEKLKAFWQGCGSDVDLMLLDGQIEMIAVFDLKVTKVRPMRNPPGSPDRSFLSFPGHWQPAN